MKNISHDLKAKILSIRMLNLTLKELRLIAKNRNIDSYKSIPKDQLISLFTHQNHQKLRNISPNYLKES